MDERQAAETRRVANLIRAEFPKLTDEEILVVLWKRLGQRNDALSRLQFPDTTGQ